MCSLSIFIHAFTRPRCPFNASICCNNASRVVSPPDTGLGTGGKLVDATGIGADVEGETNVTDPIGNEVDVTANGGVVGKLGKVSCCKEVAELEGTMLFFLALTVNNDATNAPVPFFFSTGTECGEAEAGDAVGGVVTVVLI